MSCLLYTSRQAPHPQGAILPPALLRLPGIPRPISLVRRIAALPGGTAGTDARSGLDALRHGLHRPQGREAPVFPREVGKRRAARAGAGQRGGARMILQARCV